MKKLYLKPLRVNSRDREEVRALLASKLADRRLALALRKKRRY